MKTNSKIISCICLFIYLLFGFLNTGGISFCFGNEHSKHFGINVLGYESCCKSENFESQGSVLVANNDSPAINSRCNCNDENIQAGNVSQDISANLSLHNIFNSIDFINTQLIAYYINFNNLKIPNLVPDHKIRDNCISSINNIILII